VAANASYRTLSEIDLSFARSRRRAAARRLQPARKPTARSNSARAVLVVLLVFGVVGETTRLEVSNARSSPAKVARAAALPAACGVPVRFHAAFRKAAAQTRLPVSLLVATAYEESRMDPAARSRAGAQGLFQLMPETGKALNAGATPTANILAGATYLRQLLARFGGKLDLALSAYNAGPAAVEKAGAAPSIGTLRYARNIEQRSARLASVCF
jgi:soluble lytic murein transglycosylase-like protein